MHGERFSLPDAKCIDCRGILLSLGSGGVFGQSSLFSNWWCQNSSSRHSQQMQINWKGSQWFIPQPPKMFWWTGAGVVAVSPLSPAISCIWVHAVAAWRDAGHQAGQQSHDWMATWQPPLSGNYLIITAPLSVPCNLSNPFPLLPFTNCTLDLDRR